MVSNTLTNGPLQAVTTTSGCLFDASGTISLGKWRCCCMLPLHLLGQETFSAVGGAGMCVPLLTIAEWRTLTCPNPNLLALTGFTFSPS